MDAYTIVIDSLMDKLSFEMKEEKEWLLSQVYDDLADEEDPQVIETYIEDVIKQGKLGWEHVSFSNVKQSQQEQDDYILNPFEAEEGVVECKKCGSSKVYSVSVQTRAADEPMTTMAQCTVCKTKWSYNG
jgi:DNA-directed RNA polymerase subunit M/transcription elongation factor TFIIS